MTLEEKVARAFLGDDGLPLREYHLRQARAAIAVVLQDVIKWSEKTTTNAVVPIYLKWYARESGVSLDDPQARSAEFRHFPKSEGGDE